MARVGAAVARAAVGAWVGFNCLLVALFLPSKLSGLDVEDRRQLIG